MEYQKKYTALQEQVEKHIAASINLAKPYRLFDAYKYIMSGGGKRIRPVLTMIAAGCIGGNPPDAIGAATAIEVLHNFTLVHDDIMDKSPIRRGRDTVHVKWNEDIAILAGDMMVGYAFGFLPKSSDTVRAGEICSELSNALIEVCEGQELDMAFNTKPDVTLDDYIGMIRLKTSSLLKCAARMGALIGNCTQKQYEAVSKYADNLGIAFQIQDDMLDLTAEQIKFGKRIGQDLIEGKKSFPILMAAQVATARQDVELVHDYMAAGTGLSEDKVGIYRSMFERLHIFDIAQEHIDRYFSAAGTALLDCPENEYNAMLFWLISSLNKRAY